MSVGIYNMDNGIHIKVNDGPTTLSLYDAKLLREQLDAAITHRERVLRVEDHMLRIKDAMRDGQKIVAIRLLRELPTINDASKAPIGLLEAKQIVEHLL